MNPTICAISTPLGPGGIGVIRLSGQDAVAILNVVFLPRMRSQASSKNEAWPKSHRIYYGHIADPKRGQIIDEVLAFCMKAPNSFTREDVVEIQSHSGIIVLDQILSLLIDYGAALAGPGEFTKRAFLNGRIDLSQVESIIDLINAPGEAAAGIASRQMTGALKDEVEEICKKIVDLRARCEALIEFSEEEIGIAEHAAAGIDSELRQTILEDLKRLIQKQKESAVYNEGIHVAISGCPNVGKSSLLNRIAQRETAIVSDLPGTTRDIVKDQISINGIPVVLCDTAGIHDTKDPIECIGIERARKQIACADLTLMVMDASRQLNALEFQWLTEKPVKATIVVINKNDQADENNVEAIMNEIHEHPHIRVSAKLGDGIDDLKSMILKRCLAEPDSKPPMGATPNLRQRKLLEKVKAEMEAITSCGPLIEESLEELSGMMSNALGLLAEITGKKHQADLYDQIFNQFCIGK